MDKRFKSVDKTQASTGRNMSTQATRTEKEFTRSHRAMAVALGDTTKGIDNLTKRKHRIAFDVGDARSGIWGLNRDLGALESRLTRFTRRFQGSRTGGFLGKIMGIGGSAHTPGWLSKLGDVQFNIPGPLGQVALSKMLAVLLGFGSPIIAGLGALLAGIAVSITAIGVAAGAAAVALGAFTLGIASIAVPMALAIKSTMQHRQALQSSIEKLDKAKAGTKAYASALRDVHRAQAQMSPQEAQVSSNLTLLQGAWQKFVTNGPAGREAFKIINSGLQIATSLIPTAAREMDKFTTVTDHLFERAKRNLPAFTGAFQKATGPWPRIFGLLSRGGGNFMVGMLNVVRAINPLVVQISKALLGISRSFASWTGKPENQTKMRKFFLSMYPIIKKLAVIVYDIGKAFVDIAGNPADRKGTMDMLNAIDDFVKGLPGFLTSMTKAAGPLGPILRGAFGFLVGYLKFIVPKVASLLKSVEKLTKKIGLGSGKGDTLYWAITAVAAIKIGGSPMFRGLSQMVGLIDRGVSGLGKMKGSIMGKGGKAASDAGTLARDAGTGASTLGKLSKAFGKLAGPLNVAADLGAANVHVTNVAPIPVIIVGGLGPGGGLLGPGGVPWWKGLGGKVGGALTKGGAVRGAAVAAGTGAAVVTTTGLLAGGDSRVPSRTGKKDISDFQAFLRHQPEKVTGSTLFGLIKTTQGVGAGWSTREFKEQYAFWKKTGHLMDTQKLNIMNLQAVAIHSAAAVSGSTSRSAQRSQGAAQSAIRAMVQASTSGLQTLTGFFSTAIGSVWGMVANAANAVGSLLGGAGGSSINAQGGAGSSYGPPSPMGGMGGAHGGIAGRSKLGELAPDYIGAAGALLGNLPSGGSVTAVRLGHKKMTASGNISQHWLGQAMDVGYGTAKQDAAVGKWVKANAGAFGVRSDQVFYPGNDPTGEHSGGNHHVHIGFRARQDAGGSVNSSKGDGFGVRSHVRGSGGAHGHGGVCLHFDGAQFIINDEAGYEEVAHKLATKLEHHLSTITSVDTSEMTGS